MPQLVQALRQQDYGYLQIAAQLGGMTLTVHEFNQACDELAGLILDQAKNDDFLEFLNAGDLRAISSLVENRGRILWSEFVREYGEMREMGPGKRARYHPSFQPTSVTENLFYRAMIGSAFFNTDSGPIEFAYIPSDLLQNLLTWIRPHLIKSLMLNSPGEDRLNLAWNQAGSRSLPGHPARPEERVVKWLANDRVLDDMTTYLAAKRTGHVQAEEPRLEALLHSAGLLVKGSINTDKLKVFLESSRVDAHTQLIHAWLTSHTFNELRLIPSLTCEGEWQNQPLAARSFILKELAALPTDKWWNLNSFVAAIKKEQPNFQRPAGEYDSWFIRHTSDGSYLRGFNHWDDVEGQLLRFFIRKILHWLGLADLAGNRNDTEPSAFRIPARLAPNVEIGQIKRIEENGKLKVRTGGKISVIPGVPRVIRYQLARYCEWGPVRTDEIQFWITAKSLARARSLGLKTDGLLALISKNTDGGIPPPLVKAIKGWDKNGAQTRIEQELILKVSQPAILDLLRKSKANRFLGEILGPTVVILKPGTQLKIWEMLAELGYLVEDTTGTIPK